MARGTSYECCECGYVTAKWLGRCPGCENWETLVARRPVGRDRDRRSAELVKLEQVAAADAPRRAVGIAELDRVLGGGLVPGAVVLLGGEPGVGKSTLLLQAADRLLAAGARVLYVSGEESPVQIKLRAERLGLCAGEMLVVAETEIEAILACADESAPDIVIVDSIQAVRCSDVGSAPGSVVQVRDCATRLSQAAKLAATPYFLVGHVTKDGALAGPRSLEHLVDTVLHFEGERHQSYRLLRALKNRYGATEELGVFEMTGSGLTEVENPSSLFLEQGRRREPGAAVVPAMVGSRPLLAEVQVLVGEPAHGSPRRTTLGVDANRVAMVLAVLQRRCALDFACRDVFVNVTGGLKLGEPATDLGVAMAAASSLRGDPLPDRWIFAGEIGLTGEIRRVPRIDARLREAARLGFSHAIVPDEATSGEPGAAPRRVAATTLSEAVALVFDVAADRAGPA